MRIRVDEAGRRKERFFKGIPNTEIPAFRAQAREVRVMGGRRLEAGGGASNLLFHDSARQGRATEAVRTAESLVPDPTSEVGARRTEPVATAG